MLTFLYSICTIQFKKYIEFKKTGSPSQVLLGEPDFLNSMYFLNCLLSPGLNHSSARMGHLS